MLNKIVNIESTKGYKSSNRPKSTGIYERFLHSFDEEKSGGKDSVHFSPAALFLSSVNWRLAELSYPAENELKLDFCIEDVHFYIDLDFNTFYKTAYQQIKLEKDATNNLGQKQKQTVILLVAKPQIRIFEKFPAFGINGIQKMFDKIKKLKINGLLRKHDFLVFSMLKENTEEEMYKDFTNVFYVIYSFIAKLEKFGINKASRFPRYDGERIIFDKISVKNV